MSRDIRILGMVVVRVVGRSGCILLVGARFSGEHESAIPRHITATLAERTDLYLLSIVTEVVHSENIASYSSEDFEKRLRVSSALMLSRFFNGEI